MSAIDATAMADHAAPLDALLVDATLGPAHRFLPNRSSARLASRLARKPATTAPRAGGLAAELGRIVAGTSTLAPSTRDRRFADPAWVGNPLLRRVAQAYLATGATAEQLVADAALPWRDDHRVRFALGNVTEALAPSNVPLLNPASAKAVIDSGGASLLRGGRAFLEDMTSAPRIPQMVDPEPFVLGETIAASEGAVVARTEQFELIQYRPTTEQVRAAPLLLVPPTINKYYVLDLAPQRSLIAHLLDSGQQVFVMSWRNPDARHCDWNLDTYVQAVLDALDAVERVTRGNRTVLGGICAGGILASTAAAHLAAIGQQQRLAALFLGVTVLDTARAGATSALTDRRTATAAKAVSRRKGYLDGRHLAEVFAWLRPGDLVWNYWVNNYLLGRKPPAFDILFWNADTTRMTAGLHADFIDLAMDNALVTPGHLEVLGTPIDLAKVDVDSYVVAGVADHITPWESCYRTTQLLGGDVRFVLSTSGHIAALVNPPGGRSTHQIGSDTPEDPQAWLNAATMEQGTWWPDLVAWLSARSGDEEPAPQELGGGSLRPLGEAPGTYVFDR